jgi:hypothetical protein
VRLVGFIRKKLITMDGHRYVKAVNKYQSTLRNTSEERGSHLHRGGSLKSRHLYRGADKSLARPTSRCIFFDGENISFDASLVIYINSTNIPPIMIINRIYEHQNLLSL